MIAKDRHQKAITYALKVLKNDPYENCIEKIYMFGSCARKKQKYTSDVDLLVECNETLTPELARRMRIAAMPEALDLPEIDLKFVTKDNWKKQKNQFTRNLLKEGVLLWKKK